MLRVPSSCDAADGVELDDQGLAGLDLDGGLIAHLQAVEEDRRRQHGEVAVLLALAVELLEDPGVEGGREDLALADGVAELLLHLGLLGGQVDGFEQFAGAAGEGLLPFEDDLLQLLGEAAVGLADHPLEEVDHPLREGQLLAAGEDILGLQVVLHHEHGHVADDLGGGGDLDQVAEHVVDLAVHLLALLPAVRRGRGPRPAACSWSTGRRGSRGQ